MAIESSGEVQMVRRAFEVCHVLPPDGKPFLHLLAILSLNTTPSVVAYREGSSQEEAGMVLDLKVQMGLGRVPGITTLSKHLPPQHLIPRAYSQASPAQVSEEAVLAIRMAYHHVIAKNAPG